MVKKNARYAKGTVLRLRVIRLPVYASPQPSAEHESDKTVEVIQYLSDGRIMVRMRGAQPGRSHFTGSLSGTITNMAPRPVKYEVLDVHVVSEPRSTPNRRKRKGKSMRRNAAIQMHATPYDVSASGFYFKDPDDFAVKYEKHLPVEEYEIQWIDGPEEDRELFEALDVNQATLDKFFELIEELQEHEKAALYYLLRYRGMGPKEDLDDLLKMTEDVSVMQGSSRDYVADLIDDIGMDGIGQANMQMYFDYEAFGRDLAHDMDPDDEGDAHYLEMSDQERGEEYVDSMGGVDQLGKSVAMTYFDDEAFARDLELNGELNEFDYAGKTYTTTFMG